MGEQPQALSRYLSLFPQPLKALPWSGRIPTEEEAIRWLVDEAYRAAKLMIRTHLIADKYRFVVLARIMELHGYQMQWYKHKNTVGARRKDVVNGTTSVREANPVA